MTRDLMMNAFVEGLGTGLGVLLGIVVGVVISVCVQQWERRRAHKAQFDNLIAEMRFNISKIEGWHTELARYRTAIIEDRLHEWIGYFDLRSSIFRVADTVLASGLIYEKLDFEHVKGLQAAATDLSANGMEYMNRQFANERSIAQGLFQKMDNPGWMQRKPEALRLGDFWKAKLDEHRATLTVAIDALGGVSQKQ